MMTSPLKCNQVQDKDMGVMLGYILFLCDFASEKTIRQRNKIVIEMHFLQVTCEISKILSVREKNLKSEAIASDIRPFQ